MHPESFAGPLKNGLPRLHPVHRPGSPLREEAPDTSSATRPRERSPGGQVRTRWRRNPRRQVYLVNHYSCSGGHSTSGDHLPSLKKLGVRVGLNFYVNESIWNDCWNILYTQTLAAEEAAMTSLHFGKLVSRFWGESSKSFPSERLKSHVEVRLPEVFLYTASQPNRPNGKGNKAAFTRLRFPRLFSHTLLPLPSPLPCPSSSCSFYRPFLFS